MQRRLIEVRGKALGKGQGPGEVPARQEQPRHHNLFHRIRVGARGVKDHDALLREGLHGDVVHPRAGPGHGAEPGRRGLRGQHVTAQQNTLGISELRADFKAIAGEAL